MRSTVLGHMRRGGSPNASDRNLAKAHGVDAVRANERGEKKAATRGVTNTVSIDKAVVKLKLVGEDALGFRTAKALGVFINEASGTGRKGSGELFLRALAVVGPGLPAFVSVQSITPRKTTEASCQAAEMPMQKMR